MSEFVYSGGFLLRVTDCGAETLLFSFEQKMKSCALRSWRQAFTKEQRKAIVAKAVLAAVDIKAAASDVAENFTGGSRDIFEGIEL